MESENSRMKKQLFEEERKQMRSIFKMNGIILIAALLLSGCGNSAPASSRTSADTDAGLTDAIGETEGQTVSYGPITVILPEGYAAPEEEYSNTPVYYAADCGDAEYKPNIRFQTTHDTVTSNADVNRENFISGSMQISEFLEDSEFKELVSYEETELGGYKVVKTQTKEKVYGRPLAVARYDIYEKVGSDGIAVSIKYDSLESDTEHLEAFEACLDSVALKAELAGSDSLWRRMVSFASGLSGSPLYVSGNYAEYGPLEMQLPDGYAQEGDGAKSMVFSGGDGASLRIRFAEGSYQAMADQAYAKEFLKEEFAGTGITDPNVIKYEAIRISGYDGYEIGIQSGQDGQGIVAYSYVIFETADEDKAPAFAITYAADEDTAQNMAEAVDEVFRSIRLADE